MVIESKQRAVTMSSISTAIASYSTFTQPVVRPSFRSENVVRLLQWRAWRVMSHHRGSVPVASIGRGSEGEREPPHITRNNDDDEIAHDEEYEGKSKRQLQAEKEARWQAREARVVPDTHRDLLEFFLTTEEQEMEFEVARCRPRLTKDFFAFLESELGSLRLAENETAVEDMMAELEVLEKVLREGIEAYDKLTADLPDAKESYWRWQLITTLTGLFWPF